MDALTAVLTAHRAEGAYVLRSVLEEPWSIRLEDDSPLSVVVLARGTAWLVADDGEPRLLEEGDAALVRGPGHWTLADAPGTPAQVRIGPGQVCHPVPGAPGPGYRDVGVRTWGNTWGSTHVRARGSIWGITADGSGTDSGTDADAGTTEVLTGAYESPAEVGAHLLTHLPHVVVVPRTAGVDGVVGLIRGELAREDPGQEVVLDRLVDLLTVTLLRAWFSSPQAHPPAWYAAFGDPVVGPALRHLQHEPARPWTVASLAAVTRSSRATFARRFTELVGEPPMAYLTRWRLDLAAEDLRTSTLTLEAIGRRVGYSSAFSLSAAFSRARGESPTAFRRRVRSVPPERAGGSETGHDRPAEQDQRGEGDIGRRPRERRA
ncbi:AraC family transcriptional regulator [Beutenbergia cavernae]|uniref:AraC family transcriptional regulator n=1 Tax=Beutenbergia cavernae TaxID=84757 RepID=UPI00019AC183|nr:AraC family transcriptional regulator [Beutenbergia cavernae]